MRLLFALPGLAVVLFGASPRATIDRNLAPVYSGPAASGPVVTTLKRGDAVTVGMPLSGRGWRLVQRHIYGREGNVGVCSLRGLETGERWRRGAIANPCRPGGRATSHDDADARG